MWYYLIYRNEISALHYKTEDDSRKKDINLPLLVFSQCILKIWIYLQLSLHPGILQASPAALLMWCEETP